MKKYEYGELSFDGISWNFENKNGSESFDLSEIPTLNKLGELGWHIFSITKNDINETLSSGYNVYLMEKVIE
jgi:hypothetical protein